MASNSVERSQSLTGSILKGTLKAVGGTLLGIIMIGGAAVAGGLVGLALSFRDLPDVRVLKGYVPVETTYIYDINGGLIARLHGDVNREVVTLDRISPHLKRSVLAMEDAYFYTHKGVDPSGIGRAILANFSAGGTVEGGSTLTQQLVKNLFLSNERSLNRKVAEAVLAMRVEQVFTKEQILEMYLNQVFWGKNTNGAETASQNYFGKSAADLTLGEAAMLAGTIQAPSVFNPVDNFAEAKKRQGLVLDRLLELGWSSPAEVKAAKAQKIVIRKQGISYEASRVPYVSQAVTAELEEKFGKDVVLQGGLRVQTTIDLKLQRIAEEVAAEGHKDLVDRGAYADQLALVAVDPRTGFVKALVGGVGDFDKNQFNRAVLARRQLGSSFKPFVYYAAFATGNYTPDSVIDDSPMTIPDGDEPYIPRNYDNKFSGPITIRQAIAVSRNIPALKLGIEVGAENVIAICRKLGITSPLKPVVSLPLGAADVTPLEVAGAYAVFASGGYKSKTTLIARVTDRNGNLVLDNTPKPELILDPIAVSYLTDALRGVVTNGTATEAQMSDGRPIAGKTGTTSDFRDAWFVGYVPQLAVAIWIGNDDYTPMANGVTGGVYVTPIWRKFMERALAGQPIEQFPVPSEIQDKEGSKKPPQKN
ncbi:MULTISPECIES: transglycosylase domain-containing protein [Pseudanabaena]|uniref:Penicillin-binding protein, 1A family n=2 Tax=Pseudanabaena TaxID=1152 RepID=L8N1N6_9CYAN|nr:MULTISPECIES: PBP1A family penicillin-binding protein [Pseudanabaena]ELS32989.1 penicillin-binding protein, 1A family [Pseudanabaena biceps PCC 7429]MDG3494789.1 PBP1A family penicillin-binding protein [Pseudanabaena catenata USMAC16]